MDSVPLSAMFLPALNKSRVDIRENAMDWMGKYWPISIYSSIAYVLLIYVGQQVMKDRTAFSLRQPLILWNIGLASFSFCGMCGVLPNLLNNLYRHGVVYTACQSDLIYDEYMHLILWGWLMALSKIAEFGDTFFIVLRKRPVPFLHWYHHVTVCIYTWYAITPPPTALCPWFGAMNFTVHSAMYTYYSFKASGFKIHPYIPKVITTMQLSQMFLGIFVNLLAWHTARSGRSCMYRPDLFYLGVVLYTTYAMLFVNFFYHRYIKPLTKAKHL